LAVVAGCSDDDDGSAPSTPGSDAGIDADPPDASTDGPGQDAEPDSAPDASAPGFHARFELPDPGGDVSFLSVPFPSDAYMDGDGTLVDEYPGLERLIPSAGQHASFSQQLGSCLGFGPTAGALFELMPDNPTVDVSTVPSSEETCGKPGSGAFLVDLSETDPQAMLIPCEALWHDARDFNPSTELLPPTMLVKPARGIKLPEGHRIAAILTNAIRDMDDQPLDASEDFAALRDGEERSTPLAQAYGQAIDEITEAGLEGLADVSVISSMALYDVGRPTEDMLVARDAVVAEAVPEISWDAADVAPMGTGRFHAGTTAVAGFDASLDEALGTPAKAPQDYFLGEIDDPGVHDGDGLPHDHIGAMATGVFEAPNLLRYGDGSFADPEENTFYRDGGTPAINPSQPTSKIWVTMTIPSTPPPADGYPVIVFVHGIGKDRGDMASGMNDWAKMGFATVAIDLAVQGARAPETNDAWHTDETNRMQGTYDGPDGLPDELAPSNPMLANMVGIAALRDHIRQSALDIVTLVRVIRSDPDLGPLAVAQPGAKLDGDNIQMMAVSLGGMIGTVGAALAPEIKNVAYNVSGASLGHEILPGDGVDNGVLILGIAAGWGPLVHLDRGNPYTALIAQVVDAADPLTFAPYLIREPLTIDGTAAPVRNVLAIAVLDDEMVWNGANDALARGLGLSAATPNQGVSVDLPEATATGGLFTDVPTAGQTAIYVQQSPGCHARNFYGPTCEMEFEWPFPRFDEHNTFPKLDEPFMLDMRYHEAHEMVGTFLQSGAVGVPVVAGYEAPPDDYDGDGVDNDEDTDPNDPAVQ